MVDKPEETVRKVHGIIAGQSAMADLYIAQEALGVAINRLRVAMNVMDPELNVPALVKGARATIEAVMGDMRDQLLELESNVIRDIYEGRYHVTGPDEADPQCDVA